MSTISGVHTSNVPFFSFFFFPRNDEKNEKRNKFFFSNWNNVATSASTNAERNKMFEIVHKYAKFVCIEHLITSEYIYYRLNRLSVTPTKKSEFEMCPPDWNGFFRILSDFLYGTHESLNRIVRLLVHVLWPFITCSVRIFVFNISIFQLWISNISRLSHPRRLWAEIVNYYVSFKTNQHAFDCCCSIDTNIAKKK